MNNLPEAMTKHPFFKTHKAEMSERALNYKEKMDNYHKLSKKEQFNIFKELLDLGLTWPDPLRLEGFWCELEEKNYLFKEFPFPRENEMPENEITEFLSKLEKVEKTTKPFRYMGYSKCRICGKLNGTQTHYTNLFAWPEGYKHYIEEHGVQPSAAFVLHIRGLIE